MKANDFREWSEKISQLNRHQKEQAKHYLSEAKPQAVVVKYLEDSFEPSCPVCHTGSDWFERTGQRFVQVLQLLALIHGSTLPARGRAAAPAGPDCP